MPTQTSIELQAVETLEVTSKSLVPSTNVRPSSVAGRTLDSELPASNAVTETSRPKLPALRAWIVIISLCGINFVASFSNGMLTVGLPTMAADLSLADNLLLWPNSAFYLTGGSCLLIAGSVADVIGPRRVNLPGCLLVATFILACGLARTGVELIMFRAMQGVATALIVPTAISIISTNIEDGRPRNMGFASIFLAQPLGFAIGWFVGGFFISSVGWRAGYFVGGGVGFLLTAVAAWALPRDPKLGSMQHVLKRLTREIDWIGAILASTSLALLSYVLAMLSADTSNIRRPANIALLIVSVLLLPLFVYWMHRQENLRKPVLIPNSLWKNSSFTTVCLMIMLSNATINCNEQFASLYFQEVQHLTPIQTSLRLLPQVLVGICLCFLSGIFVNRAPIQLVVLVSTVLCAVSPVLMATLDPAWNYWRATFWAMLLAPVSIDILFTVGTLIVSAAFPVKTQALAGAVFNTFSQIGSSIGFCITAIISTQVSGRAQSGGGGDQHAAPASEAALLRGYRASFWALFAWMAIAAVVGAVGLRKVGKVGVKRD